MSQSPVSSPAKVAGNKSFTLWPYVPEKTVFRRFLQNINLLPPHPMCNDKHPWPLEETDPDHTDRMKEFVLECQQGKESYEGPLHCNPPDFHGTWNHLLTCMIKDENDGGKIKSFFEEDEETVLDNKNMDNFVGNFFHEYKRWIEYETKHSNSGLDQVDAIGKIEEENAEDDKSESGDAKPDSSVYRENIISSHGSFGNHFDSLSLFVKVGIHNNMGWSWNVRFVSGPQLNCLGMNLRLQQMNLPVGRTCGFPQWVYVPHTQLAGKDDTQQVDVNCWRQCITSVLIPDERSMLNPGSKFNVFRYRVDVEDEDVGMINCMIHEIYIMPAFNPGSNSEAGPGAKGKGKGKGGAGPSNRNLIKIFVRSPGENSSLLGGSMSKNGKGVSKKSQDEICKRLTKKIQKAVFRRLVKRSTFLEMAQEQYDCVLHEKKRRETNRKILNYFCGALLWGSAIGLGMRYFQKNK